jgi:alanyl-tRNA synthetase
MLKLAPFLISLLKIPGFSGKIDTFKSENKDIKRMTEKLYYQDTQIDEFSAGVVEAVKDGKQWRVVLDKTCFYPEGGGQPADKGWINNIPVTDVQKQGDSIHHFLPQNPGPGTVQGKIDRQWRRDFMQQHTGQHIISGALWQVGKHKTVSVHMGLDYTTIETDKPDIPEQELIAAEKLANQAIEDNWPLDFIQTGDHELDKYPLRKPTSRKGSIRLVKIGDFDCVACGGIHMNTTRGVRLVSLVNAEKIRGHARTTWKIGDRALDDYRGKNRIALQLRTILGTREDNFTRKATEIQEELVSLKRKVNWLSGRLADTTAQQMVDAHEPREKSGIRVIAQSWQEEDDQLLKQVLKNLLGREKLQACLVNILPDRVLWSIGCSEDAIFPFNDVKKELLPIIEGKGGGRPPLWQGMGAAPGGVEAFLDRFKTLAG